MCGDKVAVALHFAVEEHFGQSRKNVVNGVKLPYIAHPIEVMKTLHNWETIDESMAIAALLHDTIEDCHTTAQRLQEKFGAEVTGMVVALTLIKPSDKSLQAEAKRLYMESFATVPVKVLVIKFADRYCNIKDFSRVDLEKTLSYTREAMPLFHLIEKRRSEIIAEWGIRAYDKVIKAMDEVRSYNSQWVR